MKLFTTGKLKISGNVMASQKLQALFKIDPSKAIEAVMARKGIGGAAAPAAAAAAAPSTPKAEAQAPKIFAALAKRITENPGLKGEVRAKVTFDIEGNKQTFDFGGDTAATIAATDADFAALVTGKQSAKALYQHGKLRVDGDVSVAHRLGFLKGLI
jgi:3-hydroxyacyl-CoA dehydrogenase/3a,7a,12a-trihydroxy-5b-cholest-24-enoyl-CoA hydratase